MRKNINKDCRERGLVSNWFKKKEQGQQFDYVVDKKQQHDRGEKYKKGQRMRRNKESSGRGKEEQGK
jgi:hypothetical protein